MPDALPPVGPGQSDLAALGLPAPKNQVLRRLITRLAWPVLRRQIDLNYATEVQLTELRERLDAAAGTLQQRVEHLDEVQKTLERFESTLETVGEILGRHDKGIENAREQSFARQTESNGLLRRELGELALELSEFRSTYSMSMASVLPKMAALELAFDRAPRSSSTTSTAALPEPPKPDLHAFYVALADTFRGPEAEVRDRVRGYLPDLQPVRNLGPVLDVGCGRGEMLDILQEADIEAYGIDSNPLCVDDCRKRGLSAEVVDARQHLTSLDPSSLAAVTAIHVVEHLSIEELVDFVDLAMMALKPGGKLILETPNPENIIVSSLYFYLDPTHRHPIPPALLQFILASRGIVDLEIRRLVRENTEVSDPTEGEPWFGDVKPVIDAVNDRFSGPPDYAVIARRP